MVYYVFIIVYSVKGYIHRENFIGVVNSLKDSEKKKIIELYRKLPIYYGQDIQIELREILTGGEIIDLLSKQIEDNKQMESRDHIKYLEQKLVEETRKLEDQKSTIIYIKDELFKLTG